MVTQEKKREITCHSEIYRKSPNTQRKTKSCSWHLNFAFGIKTRKLLRRTIALKTAIACPPRKEGYNSYGIFYLMAWVVPHSKVPSYKYSPDISSLSVSSLLTLCIRIMVYSILQAFTYCIYIFMTSRNQFQMNVQGH